MVCTYFLSLLLTALRLTLSRYDEKDFQQKSTSAAALGSVQIADIRGFVCARCLYLSMLQCSLVLHLCCRCFRPAAHSLFQVRSGSRLQQRVCGCRQTFVALSEPYFAFRKFGMELKGPDKSYFLWAASQEALDVRSLSCAECAFTSIVCAPLPTAHVFGRISFANSRASPASNPRALTRKCNTCSAQSFFLFARIITIYISSNPLTTLRRAGLPDFVPLLFLKTRAMRTAAEGCTGQGKRTCLCPPSWTALSACAP